MTTDVMLDVDRELASATDDVTIEAHVRAVIAALVRARREIASVAADAEVVAAIHEHRRFGRRNVMIITAVARAMRARAAQLAPPFRPH